MNIDNSVLTFLIVWIVNLSFIVAVAPQIYLNYKRKSAKGLSDLFLAAYLSGYTFNFLYSFALNLEFPYKVRGILAMLAAAYMVYQRFIYNWKDMNNFQKHIHISTISFLIISSIFVFIFPIKGGHFSGWLLVFIWAIYQLPQIFKIHKNKSVVGLSFLFFTLVCLGNLLELSAAIILSLPPQSYVIAINGILVYFIFVYQFYKYGYFKKYF
jgi:uncharacterized protein with PQ loop repeat